MTILETRSTVLAIIEARIEQYRTVIQEALAAIEQQDQASLLYQHDRMAARTRIEIASAKRTALCDLQIELRSKHLI